MTRNCLSWKLSLCLLGALLVTVTASTDAMAKNLYVSPDGDGSNGESWKTAWVSPAKINWKEVAAGDRIIIDGGTTGIQYTGAVVIPKGNIVIRQSRRPGRNGQVTISGPPFNSGPIVPHGVTINADNVYIVGNKRSGIKISYFGEKLLVLRGNNCVIKNVELSTLTGFPPYGYGRFACLDFSGYNNRIRNCDFRDVTTNARETIISGKKNLTVFKNCTFGVDRYGYWGEFSNGIVGSDEATSNDSIYAIKCIFGPYCNYGVDINSGNIFVSRSLFLGAHLTNFKWSAASHSNSKAMISRCTFFTENLTGATHYPYRIQQLATARNANLKIKNSIFYGGNVAIPAGTSVNGGGNFQYRVSGNTQAIANQIVDPMFIEDKAMSAEVTPATIRPRSWTTTSYALKPGSPATGKGSPILNVTDIVPAYGPDRGFPPLGGP